MERVENPHRYFVDFSKNSLSQWPTEKNFLGIPSLIGKNSSRSFKKPSMLISSWSVAWLSKTKVEIPGN